MWMRSTSWALVALMLSGFTMICLASAQPEGSRVQYPDLFPTPTRLAAATPGPTPEGAITPQVPTPEVKLQEFRPWLVQHQKVPAQAKGVIYFIRGASPGLTFTSGQAAPFFCKTLSESGWDVIGARLPKEQVDSLITPLRFLVRQTAAFVHRRVNELKGEGYKRVILGGHSWGGWVALAAAQSRASHPAGPFVRLHAARNPDYSADALLVSAPNTFGSRISAVTGKPNPNFHIALTRFEPLLQNVKTPTVLILPDDTDWDPDPGARGEIAERHFTLANVPHLIIAKPPGFSGHLAGWLPIFDYRYGTCIQAFLENPNSDACPPRRIASDDFRSIIDIRQVVEANRKSISSAQELAGKNFVAFTMADVVNKYYRYVSPGQRVTMVGNNEASEDFTVRDGLHCVGTTCSRLVRWSDGYLLEFDQNTGRLNAWWVENR
jgi:pimeloyl-ACP methyl ester carboxylesterase